MPPFYGKSRFGGNEKETPDLCLRMFRYVSDAYSDSSQKPTQSSFPEKPPVVMAFFVAHTAGIKLFRILTGFLSVSCFFHHTAVDDFCQRKKESPAYAGHISYSSSPSISVMKPSLSRVRTRSNLSRLRSVSESSSHT